MPLSPQDRQLVNRFREGVESSLAGDPRFTSVSRDDREDESTLASRFAVAPSLWVEVVVRPFIPQVRAGIVTDDRWKNEDLEDKIEESGDTMSEFVELGFDEAGLEWPEPPVEHYRDQGRYFCFSTGLELERLAELADPAVLDKVRRMLEGYYTAFKPAIEKAAAVDPPGRAR
jgi:hypothetical protein